MNIPELLSVARQELKTIRNVTISLKQKYPEIFSEEGLLEALNSFLTAHEKAEKRLASPTFSIATIGTTSSGKSTVVNALIGKRIAPIEAKEMSGGVLTLRHRSKRRLTVEKTEDSSWDSGTWEDISDEDTYLRCKQVMLQYHQDRKEKVEFAPEITYEGPLLPGSELDLLGLSKEIIVEFIDLPGLKSLQDRKNLAVIQSKIEKAFNLVVLDYNQTDEAKRKKLLEELKKTVEFLAGRSDLMIFVLNRVDNRGRDDEPLEERIELLRKEIKDVLQLKKEPEIIPLTARLLYNVQCAWGAGSAEKNDSPLSSLKNRQKHLEALFEDCAVSLRRLSKKDRKIKRNLYKIEDAFDNGELPNDDDLRTLLHQQRDWSGGTKLWSRLNSRLKDSFAELFFTPILRDTLLTHNKFMTDLRSRSEIRKTKNENKLKKNRENIEKTKKGLHTDINTTVHTQKNKIETAIRELRKGKRVGAENILGKGFLPLVTAVDDMIKDLQSSLVQPIRRALKNNRGCYDLEDELQKILPLKAANRLARAYESFKRHIGRLKRNKKEKTFSISVHENNHREIELLEEIRRDTRRLYKNMRECMASRAEFILQVKIKLIQKTLIELLNNQTKEIKKTCVSKLKNSSIRKAIESARLIKSRNYQPKLPSTLFHLPVVNEKRHRTKREVVDTRYGVVDTRRGVVGTRRGVVDTRYETENYTSGTCLKDKKTRIVKKDVMGNIDVMGNVNVMGNIDVMGMKDVMGNVAYQDLELPNEDGMAEQWIAGIKRVEKSLWKILQDWMIDELRKSSKEFSDIIETILGQADRAFEKQQQIVKNEFNKTLALWINIDRHTERLEITNERFSKIMKTENLSDLVSRSPLDPETFSKPTNISF